MVRRNAHRSPGFSSMMLLIPIVLWWAKAPMRFAAGGWGLTIGMINAAAIVFVTMSPSATAQADDRLPASDTLPRVAENAGGDDPLGSRETVKTIREGTIIAPTRGHIVMVGRRWAFVADKPVQADDNDFIMKPVDENDTPFRLSGFRGPSDISPVRTTAPEQASLDRPNRFFGPVTLVTTPEATELPDQRLAVPQMLLSENLNLQRIVEAIRSDASDDRWIISGEMTEFMNSNFLIIRTAQRSNSK